MMIATDDAGLERALVEAVKYYETVHAVVAAAHLQLEAALTAIRDGRRDNALDYIVAALELRQLFPEGLGHHANNH